MSTRDKRFYHALFGIPAQQMINNSLNTYFVFGRHVFMAKVYEVKNAIQGIFDVVPGTVFNTDDGFYVLIALYNVVLRWCCVPRLIKILPAIMYKFLF
jgi:hypothetical protein